MSSLSDEMKSKREVRRKSAVLIIDEDLGNFGLYKSILAVEYELECVCDVSTALSLCKSKQYDVIVADGCVGVEKIQGLYGELKKQKAVQMPELLIIEEPDNKEAIIRYFCVGAKGYITKPFTKEGMSNMLYDVVKNKRQREVNHSILIVDEDQNALQDMKKYLQLKYNVNIVNDGLIAREFIKTKRPDLILYDASMMDAIEGLSDELDDAYMNRKKILFTTYSPDEQMILHCAKYKPEGFIVKPITEQELINTIDRVFLVDSYISSFENR